MPTRRAQLYGGGGAYVGGVVGGACTLTTHWVWPFLAMAWAGFFIASNASTKRKGV